jgi:hypothetical protein
MSVDETAAKVSLFAKIVLIFFVVFMILSYLIALVLGPLIFFFSESGSEIAFHTIPIKFFLAGWPYAIPMEVSAGLGFASCWVIYCAAFFASYISGERFHKLLMKSEGYTLDDFTKNFLFSMPIITTLLYTALVVIVLLQVFIGISSGPTVVTSEPSSLIMFFYLTYSSVAEEVGFRLIPIGLFTTVSLLIVARKRFKSKIEFFRMALFGFLFPDKAKEVAGVKSICKFGLLKGISIYEWIIILLTSVIFGFDHYYFGAWNIGKITTASIFGIALALAYLVYGIHAPILIHWWFNYYFEVFLQAHHFNSSISWISFISLIWLVILLAGTIGWMLISSYGVRGVTDGRRGY